MKKVLFILVCALFAVSCKNAGENAGNKSGARLPAVSGKLNQVLVVIENRVWESTVGDTIRAWFEQEQDGLPQAEPIFDLMHLPKSHFDKNIKGHRNVLQVEISSLVDSASIRFIESPWARTQKMIVIEAPDRESFYKVFNENKMRIIATYSKIERDRLVEVYRKTADTKIFNLMKNKYNTLFYAPTGYYINKDTLGFVWMSSETARYSQGIFFFTDPYEDENQLNHVVIMHRVNEELKRFVPASIAGSYMSIDMEIPYTLIQYQYNGHYAYLFRGLWTAVNDYMAGPYVLNVVLDEQRNRLIYTMGYVYYPSELKRNLMKQVEAVINTMVIDYEDTGK